MDRIHGTRRYQSFLIQNDDDGMIGQELRCLENGKSTPAAKLIVWDAQGQYSIETMVELPLDVLEEFITETRQKTRIQ